MRQKVKKRCSDLIREVLQALRLPQTIIVLFFFYFAAMKIDFIYVASQILMHINFTFVYYVWSVQAVASDTRAKSSQAEQKL